MAKESIFKGMMGVIIATPLVGAALGGIGTNIGGSLAGIGRATQSLVATGFMGHAAKMSGATKLFKKR